MGCRMRNWIGACGVVLLLILFNAGQAMFVRWAEAPRVELQCHARPPEKISGSIEKCWVSDGYRPDPPDYCRCEAVGLGWNWGLGLLVLNALLAAVIATAAVFQIAGHLFTRLLWLNGSIVAGYLASFIIALNLDMVNESGMFFAEMLFWGGMYCGTATAVFLLIDLLVRRLPGRT